MKNDDSDSEHLLEELAELDKDDEKLRIKLESNARHRRAILEKIRLCMKLGAKNKIQRNVRSPDAITAFLTAYGRAATTAQITAALNEQGIIIKEPSVRSALVRFHNKKIRFKRTGRNLYDLIDRKEAE